MAKEPVPVETDLNQTPEQPDVTPLPESQVGKVGPGSKYTKITLTLLVVAIIAGGGYFTWSKLAKPKADTSQTDTKKDIPLFKYGMISGPTNTFYPSNSTNVDEYAVNEQIFEGLVTFRDKKIVPNLATSWTNPDESTWVFNLKSNVKFHTGRTMTAEDVKASLESAKETELGEIYGPSIKTVEVVEGSKIKVVTDGPDPILLNKLVFLMIYDTKSEKKSHPVNGTGPYTLKAGTEPTDKHLELVAFDDYHGGHAYVRELQFTVMDDDDKMAAALKDGSVNLASFSGVEAADPFKSAGYEPYYIDDPTVFGLHFNQVKTGPLQKLKVRQAIYQAIDVDAFLKNIQTTGNAASQFVVKDIPGYNPNIKRPAYDPTAAKQLLKEAGYPNGFTMSFTYLSTVSILRNVATELTRQLKDIGITVKGDPLAKGAGEKIEKGQTESFYYGYASDLLDMSDVIGGTFKSANYNNPQVNQLLAKANKTFDSADRLQQLQQIAQLLADDVAGVPIYSGTAAYMLDKPYVLTTDIPATSYPGVYFWRVYQK